MRRDSIFYKLFQQSPTLLFELLTNPPINADAYRFDSVAVKEPKFEIDGVFLPPENEGAGIVYFCEVQFQKDEQLYERVFAEKMGNKNIMFGSGAQFIVSRENILKRSRDFYLNIMNMLDYANEPFEIYEIERFIQVIFN